MSEQNPNFGRIMSFSRRGSRLGDKFEKVMEEHAARFVIPIPAGEALTTIADDAFMDLAEAFGRDAPLTVEIGPGSGEQTIANALANPDRNYLAVEAWAPGVARCVNAAQREGAHNVRIIEVDAAQALPIIFRTDVENPNRRADEVWTFFPDPWRKKKHFKRRIVKASFARTIAGVLKEGGIWRLATDWDSYAWQMRDVVTDAPEFTNPHEGQRVDPADDGAYEGGFAPRFEHRVMTRFEQRGIDAGRTIHDLKVVRVPGEFPLPVPANETGAPASEAL
ncbi:tRNA (guanine-N7-)-methyltransferase [Arcanobacterium wilhelmae]|uniref:tRNA (guanine-N(7)-)-methyltransferase n=1 Tax=Arcanobacterium wilhelmae TaxID=1803177 RepID=A0ABT9NDI5_9ACTO|nr:tRNA (guanosine(46)-N7)-methyltransferase TrmB [Arcanobacterium wilhelmae]MDP9801722.1 tRNA (guanine-N7-)-methyltransferase [Arcanobacterium wilhelmae]WFN91040.1 tRNA (guanosine(46)-N7)-methyltransferase TrmB [Arcanobacterium wilhelmae]